MCQLLKAWRKECEWDRQQTANETVSEDDYLFRQPNGKPMNPCTFTYRFKLILKANNLPLDLNVHSLRHTNASLLIAQGMGCSNPLFYCSIKSMQNKKSSTP